MSSSDTTHRWLPAFGAAIPLVIIFITVLSVILSAVQNLGLSPRQTSSWILALYGISGFLSLVLTLRFRQPLLLTGNIFVIIFITSLGDQIGYPELIGATMVAGGFVVLITILGWIGRLAAWIPPPIVFGLLAGAILPFVLDIFTSLIDAPVLVGTTVIAYLISRRALGERLPPVLSALAVGLAATALTGQFGGADASLSPPVPIITAPDFSVQAIATAAPVIIVLITVQANLPSLVYLLSQDYQPAERALNTISGVGTMLGSLLGPTGISLSLPATSLVASSKAGSHPARHRAVYIAGGAAVAIGLLAGPAAVVPEIIPLPLLLTLAGLSLLDIFANALQRITKGPLLLGPLFAFVIALSKIEFLGFGHYFWALVIGLGVSLMLERDGMRKLREEK